MPIWGIFVACWAYAASGKLAAAAPIVKQHGGRIDVETEPGQFTEFTIVLPRKSNLSGRDRGKA
jgi:nitrogen-specific signal transduction histidine kinase